MGPVVMGVSLGTVFSHAAVWKIGRAMPVPKHTLDDPDIDPDPGPEQCCSWHPVCPCSSGSEGDLPGQGTQLYCHPIPFPGVKLLLGRTLGIDALGAVLHSYPFCVSLGKSGRPMLSRGPRGDQDPEGGPLAAWEHTSEGAGSPAARSNPALSPQRQEEDREQDGASRIGSLRSSFGARFAGHLVTLGEHEDGGGCGFGEGVSEESPEDQAPEGDSGTPRPVKGVLPECATAELLSSLRRDAEETSGGEVKAVVVTVPVWFKDPQRVALLQAAEISGLQILRLVSEPVAALLPVVLSGKLGRHRRKVLAVHWGAGGVGACAALVRGGEVQVLGSAGAQGLGCLALEERLFWHCAKVVEEEHGTRVWENEHGLRRLRADACAMAYALSFDNSVTFACSGFSDKPDCVHHIKRAQFEGSVSDIAVKGAACVLECLTKLALAPQDLDDVFLLGGATRVPCIRRILRTVLGDKALGHPPLTDGDAAAGAAALGAAIGAPWEPKARGRPRVLLQESARATYNATWQNGDCFSHVIVPRWTPLPAAVTRTVQLPRGAGTACEVRAFEGDNPLLTENSSVATVLVEHIHPAPDGQPTFLLTFKVDVNGILSVVAESAQCFKFEADVSPGRLTQREVEAFREQQQREDKLHRKRRARQRARAALRGSAEGVLKACQESKLMRCASAQERVNICTLLQQASRLSRSTRSAVEEVEGTRKILEDAVQPLKNRKGLMDLVLRAKLAVVVVMGSLLAAAPRMSSRHS